MKKECYCEKTKPLPVDIKQSDKCADEGQEGKNDICKCTGTVYYGTYDSIEADVQKMAQKDVNGEIKCENSAFGDPLYGTKKECFCKHQNPSVLDEEI